eukprot:CAMPEP_0113399764 /NCGR_PEP_ID=MMETSP0013_2-20120614/15730_1 /TAXON_ID=2843 ORGANISM="Skeletonema costatum, Strain 1716" /NCGR_SAMPLE_ID=MMETSP0013_2 /ASSEMBLY_ACC=CAM_ASM_000158 /LENGTH=312 /DNA_ID=CAMNT_0000284721 /DNA_START=51 /DNA_END=989 /DNA_ORIENTATION=- /assembly_acc=CAM_ASM_000158
MSNGDVEAVDMMMWCCASCGVAEVDEIKLKKCNDCDLVRYCSDKCQQEHISQHELSCKERAAELRDEILFRQPASSHLGDCLICLLPISFDDSLDANKCFVLDCCSKMFCVGCAFAIAKREREESLEPTCPFCRQSTKKVDAKKVTKRIQANDPVAFSKMGKRYYDEGDYKGALKYLTKAAELGAVDAHFHLSLWYQAGGRGVEKNKKKELYHTEEAAIGGHPGARQNLACLELRTGRVQRAVKHFIIAANLGLDDSIKEMKECYKHGVVSKEDFAAALRAYQAAVDAAKSPQREEAAKYDAIVRGRCSTTS